MGTTSSPFSPRFGIQKAPETSRDRQVTLLLQPLFNHVIFITLLQILPYGVSLPNTLKLTNP